jgi:tetratricopeptide (TPR) repeat protein
MGAPTRFVGRASEMEALGGIFERARKGEGALVLVEGEAGVGKSRLVSEALALQKQKGLTVLEGRCAEGSDPYLPFITAFSDTATIEGAFLIYRDGRVIAHWSRRTDFAADAEVVSGMLSAIQDFIIQSFSGTPGGALREVRHGGLDLIMEHGEHAFLAVVVAGPRPLGLQEQMKGVLLSFHQKYAGALEKWDGVVDRFAGVEESLREIVSVRQAVLVRLGGHLAGLAPGDPRSAERDRERMFESLSWHVQVIAGERPLSIFIDDIQWVDVASLNLLHYLARTTRSSPVVLICTCRPEDIDFGGPLSRTLQEMGRERLLTRMQLRRLPDGPVREMAGELFGLAPGDVPPDFFARLYSETEGNPFFVEEVLRSLVDEGLAGRPGAPAPALGDIRIPSRVEDVVLRRVGRLGEADREVLGFAAAIGSRFDFELLRRASRLDEMELASSLERVVKSGLVSEDLRFDHGMVREVLYKRIPPFKLAVMHKRLGLALEEMHPADASEACSALSHHFSKGNVPDKAVKYSVMAGERARARFAPDEALRHFSTALYFVENSEDRESGEKRALELRLLLALEELCAATAELERGIEHARRAARVAEGLGDRPALSRAQRDLGDLFLGTGEWEQARAHYRLALETAEAAEDRAGSSAALRAIGNVQFRTGDYAGAINYHQQSLNLASGLAESEGGPLRMLTYIELANVYTEKGECDTAVEYYERAMDLGVRTRSLREVATVLNNLGDVHLKRDECDLAAEYFEKALGTFREMGTVTDIVVTLCNLGESCARCGDVARARAYSDEALRYLRRLGEVEVPFQLHQNWGIIYRHQGEFEMSIEHFEAAVEMLRDANMPYYLGSVHYEMGLAYRDRGDTGNARGQMARAADILSRVGADSLSKKVQEELGKLDGREPGTGNREPGGGGGSSSSPADGSRLTAAGGDEVRR